MHGSELVTIQAWQQGDEQAVRAIFNIYYPKAVRLAVLSGLDAEQAQDCAQEAFLHAFERRYQLRDPLAFPLWFHRIITRHILDTLKARSRNREVSLESTEDLTEDWERSQISQPDELAIATEGREQLWHNVQMLSPHYRVPLVLRYYGDFSLREVADLMGKREVTIRVIIHRALQQLRSLSKHKDVERLPSIEASQI